MASTAVAQDYGAEYAKTKGGGLFLNNMELKQSPAEGKNSARESVGMNGYVLTFQQDYNLCLKRQGQGGEVGAYAGWCVSDEKPSTFMNTRKVVFDKGTLKALDGAGKVIWQSTPKNDPYAKIIISPQGKLMITNAVGAVYWSKP
jgi:hypothetical protein